jgi:hypothetical protein
VSISHVLRKGGPNVRPLGEGTITFWVTYRKEVGKWWNSRWAYRHQEYTATYTLELNEQVLAEILGWMVDEMIDAKMIPGAIAFKRTRVGSQYGPLRVEMNGLTWPSPYEEKWEER